MTTELIEITAENASTIFGHNGLEQFVAHCRAEVGAEVPDISTRKGRDRIASLAAQVSRSKTAVEKPGREYLKRIKELPKAIEAELRAFVQQMDALRDEVRQPLNEWEQREEMRKAKHQAGVDQINQRLECRDLDASELKANIAWLEGLAIGESWEEYEAEAARAKDKALLSLRDALLAREKYEAEQAELAELRRKQAEQEQKDREARIAQEAADNAKREAERQAQAERDAAAQRERELELQAERAKREKLEAEQKAQRELQAANERAEQAAANERQRQADEQARIEAEAKAREKDKAHKAAINRAAMEAFIAGGMPEACAKQAVTMIAKREIPSVSIHY